MMAAFVAMTSTFLGAVPTFAFGDSCGGHAVECYDKVRLPDVYALRSRHVLVSPGWRSVIPTPPVIRNYAVPVVVRPGRWRTHVLPPVYGMRVRRVMVAPPVRAYEDIPPVTRRVTRTVVVPGGVAWEHRRGLFGRETLCKVRTAATTRTVERDVVVRPGRRISRVVAPASYARVAEPVLLRPARGERVYEPPVHAIIGRSVVVRPAGVAVYDHPPVAGVVTEKVLVRAGGAAWVPAR
jgi:hypothetical protein